MIWINPARDPDGQSYQVGPMKAASRLLHDWHDSLNGNPRRYARNYLNSPSAHGIPFLLPPPLEGFKTIIHTNGDVLRGNKKLCRDAVEVFDEITPLSLA